MTDCFEISTPLGKSLLTSEFISFNTSNMGFMVEMITELSVASAMSEWNSMFFSGTVKIYFTIFEVF